MSKDRAAPFSGKHRRYWIPVTGGMVLIGVINVLLGYCSYSPPPDQHERIQLNIPPSSYKWAKKPPAPPTTPPPDPATPAPSPARP